MGQTSELVQKLVGKEISDFEGAIPTECTRLELRGCDLGAFEGFQTSPGRPQLRELMVFECTGFAPDDWLDEFPSLETLIIKDSELAFFPSGLGALSGLKWVELHGEYDQIPREIGLLRGLYGLVLVGCFPELPSDLHKLTQLRYIHVESGLTSFKTGDLNAADQVQEKGWKAVEQSPVIRNDIFREEFTDFNKRGGLVYRPQMEEKFFPLIPLASTILFPGTSISLKVSHPETLHLPKIAKPGWKVMAVPFQDPTREEIQRNIWEIGVLAEVTGVDAEAGKIQLKGLIRKSVGKTQKGAGYQVVFTGSAPDNILFQNPTKNQLGVLKENAYLAIQERLKKIDPSLKPAQLRERMEKFKARLDKSLDLSGLLDFIAFHGEYSRDFKVKVLHELDVQKRLKMFLG